jgi:VanZ family protein
MMNKKNKRGFLFTILFAIFIMFLSLVPSDINGGAPLFYFPGIDKVIHGMMYGFFTVLALYEFFKYKRLSFLPFLLIMLSIFFYSILMEILQYYLVESRSGEVNDVLANLTGILIGALLIFLLKKIRS